MGMMEDKMMGMKGGGKQPMGQMQGMSGAGSGMGMKGMMAGEMAGMGSMTSGGMSGIDQSMMGMMGMPPSASMGAMAMPTALPGFPGASHLYHIGSTGFFLDHGEHITLTTEQQTALNAVKEQALLDKATAQRKIDAAEQELWTLTASDQPDAAKIETKVQEIEKLRGDQRLNFIRAVGEAAKVLTDEQRKSLLGQLPPQGSQPAPAGGMGGGGMKDM
jgi:Spy/CpxP family protein refolding chaperone